MTGKLVVRGIDPAPSAFVLLEALCRDPCAPRHTFRGARQGHRGDAAVGASVRGGRGRAGTQGRRGEGEEGQTGGRGEERRGQGGRRKKEGKVGREMSWKERKEAEKGEKQDVSVIHTQEHTHSHARTHARMHTFIHVHICMYVMYVFVYL